MPELSIIVPVYKVEKYLPKCIDSILAQTFTDFELILIDDGSPDNCGAICDEYAKRDSRIIAIHQENQGVSAARNAGLDVATGTYLGFVDSDDWIEPEMYETMICVAKEKQVDVVACGYTRTDDRIIRRFNNATMLNTKTELLEDIFSKPSLLKGTTCNKVYMRQKIKMHFHSDMTIWEDLCFLMENYIYGVSTAAYICEPLYHYRVNCESATRQLNMPEYGRKQFKKYFYDLLIEYNTYITGKAIVYFLDSSVQLIHQYREISKKTGQSATAKIARVKLTIGQWVIYSRIKRLINKSQQHRFVIEGIIRA